MQTLTRLDEEFSNLKQGTLSHSDFKTKFALMLLKRKEQDMPEKDPQLPPPPAEAARAFEIK